MKHAWGLNWHECTNGDQIIEIRIPSGSLSNELAHLSQAEHMAVLEPAIKTIANGFRRVREARRGPATDIRDIIFGRDADRTDPLG